MSVTSLETIDSVVLQMPTAESLINGIGSFIQSVMGYVPNLGYAILIGILGLILGHLVKSHVNDWLVALGVQDALESTAIGGLFDGERTSVGVGTTLTAWFIYLVTLYLIAGLLELTEVQNVLGGFVFFLPELLAGAAVAIVGLVVAGQVGSVVADSETAAQLGLPNVLGELAATVVAVFGVVVGLQIIGVDSLLLAVALILVGLPVALAAGLGGKSYVAERLNAESVDSVDN
ncbi:MAG: mechanosensitive ion channel family protein [Halococcoides sp.]